MNGQVTSDQVAGCQQGVSIPSAPCGVLAALSTGDSFPRLYPAGPGRGPMAGLLHGPRPPMVLHWSPAVLPATSTPLHTTGGATAMGTPAYTGQHQAAIMLG